MLEENTVGSNLTRKATLLMAEVMQMANRVLPLTIAASIQAVPQVFNLASDYNRGEHRMVGTSAISAIDSFNRNRARLQPNGKGTRPRLVLLSFHTLVVTTRSLFSQGQFRRGRCPSRATSSRAKQDQDRHANGRQDIPVLLA